MKTSGKNTKASIGKNFNKVGTQAVFLLKEILFCPERYLGIHHLMPTILLKWVLIVELEIHTPLTIEGFLTPFNSLKHSS